MKFLLENGSIIVFVISYFFLFDKNIMTATATMIASAIIFNFIAYLWGYKLSVISHISTAVLLVMGSMTIYLDDPRIIKIKPTLLNLLFSIVLLTSSFRGQGLIKYLFNGVIEMSEANWIKLSKRFGIYFLVLALINEFIWRNFSQDFWISFKLKGMLPISFAFMLSQIPFLMRHKLNEKDL